MSVAESVVPRSWHRSIVAVIAPIPAANVPILNRLAPAPSPDWQAPAVTYSGVQTRCPSLSGEATLPQPGPVGTRDSKISPQHVSTNFAG